MLENQNSCFNCFDCKILMKISYFAGQSLVKIIQSEMENTRNIIR